MHRDTFGLILDHKNIVEPSQSPLILGFFLQQKGYQMKVMRDSSSSSSSSSSSFFPLSIDGTNAQIGEYEA